MGRAMIRRYRMHRMHEVCLGALGRRWLYHSLVATSEREGPSRSDPLLVSAHALAIEGDNPCSSEIGAARQEAACDDYLCVNEGFYLLRDYPQGPLPPPMSSPPQQVPLQHRHTDASFRTEVSDWICT